jgi:glyoxylase I family protein
MAAFNHIAFNCRDVRRQEQFYIRHFGFKRSRKLGSMRLELFPTDSVKAATAGGGEQTLGFKHLAFDVPSLEPVLEALKKEGIQPDRIIDCSQLVPGMRIVFFRDMEGNIIELMEGYADEA